ncbi:MAG: C-terminal binding protein [Chloroflexi bacterium]|nr:C-terminal binding protein [Chloroflexota bacterium]
MTFRVFQVDPIDWMMPYEYEHEAMQKLGGELIIGNCQSDTDVIEQAQGAEILLLSWQPLITPRAMSALSHCRLIIRWGVGYDMIDADAAAERGIAVANTPSYCTEDVAEHAIALLTAGARRVPWFQERMRQGGWPQAQANPIYRMRGRTLGIIGIGRIGSAVAWRARGLGLRVIAYDKYLKDDEVRARQAEPVSLDQLLAEADYISIHVPLNKETRHMVDAAVLQAMKPGALLINTSRGPVIDEQALIRVLAGGHLAGAALDVFEEEPLAPDSPLRQMEHVILTPHYGAYSVQSWPDMRVELCQAIADWVQDGWSKQVVNPWVRPNLRPRMPVEA